MVLVEQGPALRPPVIDLAGGGSDTRKVGDTLACCLGKIWRESALTEEWVVNDFVNRGSLCGVLGENRCDELLRSRGDGTLVRKLVDVVLDATWADS